ncbi:hypothetical protein BH23ACT11_BH23ACT11_13310 [soil metagenome]|jgi:hypothetical protein
MMKEILSHAQGNATAFVLSAFAFLKERGLDPEDYVAFFGRWVAPGWEEMRRASQCGIMAGVKGEERREYAHSTFVHHPPRQRGLVD